MQCTLQACFYRADSLKDICITGTIIITPVGCIKYLMDIKQMRRLLGDTQCEFSKRYGIPLRTIQNWENGVRKPPQYVLDLLEKKVERDCVNHRTFTLPKYDPKKINLPKRGDYYGAMSWLAAVQKVLGSDIVFALDEALFCGEWFLGRNYEFIVWIYGDDSLTKYNGVVVLGNQIDPLFVKCRKGIRYTDFNRTLADAFANEDILDMQGITESLSTYYYEHGESFEGISVPPEYQTRFEELADDAINYYSE